MLKISSKPVKMSRQNIVQAGPWSFTYIPITYLLFLAGPHPRIAVEPLIMPVVFRLPLSGAPQGAADVRF
jgi:hypothetical protein